MEPNMEQETLVLDPVLYDAMDLAVNLAGGIGAGEYEMTLDEGRNLNRHDGWDVYTVVPFCAVGFQWHLVKAGDVEAAAELVELQGAPVLFDTTRNDEAVVAVNKRKGLCVNDLEKRITWKQYCKERKIVRGSA